MPELKQKIALLVIVAVVLGFGLLAVSASHEDTTRTEDVDDEPLIQDVGNWTAVAAADEPGLVGFDGQVTVVNHNGDELVEGTDYEWSAENGSVNFYATADTTDGENATIAYSYDIRPEQADSMLAPLQTMFDITGGALPLVLAVGAVFAAVRLLGNAVPSKGYGGRR